MADDLRRNLWMEDSDTDNDTTDKDTDGTGSVEVFDVRNEEPGVNVEGEIKTDQEESNGAESEDEQSEEGAPVANKELERKLRELEAEVMILKQEEMLLKQMLSGAITKQQMKNRLKFYKFSGLYVSKCTHNKLRVDLTPTLYGRRPGYSSYYIEFHILSENCFVVGNSHLPSGIRETLCKEKVSLAELQNLLNYLRHICECTERKMKQFIEAEKEQGNALKGHRINVSHKIFIFDNLHVQVAFRPTAQKYSHMWFVVYLLYNDKEIFFEPQGVQVESNGFSEETQEKLKELFVDGYCQELTFTVYKAKNFISDVLEYMTKHESSFEYGDTSSN